MCQLAMELELGIAEGVYDDERAEGYARELLMPEGERQREFLVASSRG